MAESDELTAFDAIAGEVNETKRQVLFGKYTLKTKTYIINKMKLESEKIIKENGKAEENRKNIKKRINLSNKNLKCLQEATSTMKSSNCEMKKELLLMKMREEKLKKNTENIVKKYTQKWSDYENVYESTLQAKKRSALKTEIKLKTFLLQKDKYEKSDCKEALKRWQEIHRCQEQNAFINFAIYMVTRHQELRLIWDKRNNLRALMTEINQSTKERNSIRAQVENLKLSCTLQKSSTFMPKTFAMQINKNIMDDLPYMQNFLDTFDSEIPVLEMTKLSQPPHGSVKLSHKSEMKEEMFVSKPSSSYDQTKSHSGMEYCVPFDPSFIPKASYDYRQEPDKKDQTTDVLRYYGAMNYNSNPSFETEPLVTDCGVEELNEFTKINESKKITILENSILSQGTSATMVYNTIKNGDSHQVKNICPKDNIEIVNRTSCKNLEQHGTGEETEQDSEEEELISEHEDHKNEVDMNASSDNIVIPSTEHNGDTQCKTNTEVPLDSETRETIVGSELPSTASLEQSAANDNTGQDDSSSPPPGPSFNLSGGSQLDMSCSSVLSYEEIKKKILQKYQLTKSPKFVYAKNTTVMPKYGNEQCSKYFPKIEHENPDAPLKFVKQYKGEDGQNEATTSTNELRSKTESKQATIPKAVTPVQREIEKPTEPFIDEFHSRLMFSGIPPSLDTQGQLDHSLTDYTQLLETPADLLLSPKYEEQETNTQEAAKESSQTSSSFLFGLGHMKKSAFGMFGEMASSGKQAGDAGNDKPRRDDFSFNFGASPGTKRKKSGFFSLFNN